MLFWRRKKKTMDTTDPDFSFWVIFFFFSLLKSSNISRFWSKSKKNWLKFFENN